MTTLKVILEVRVILEGRVNAEGCYIYVQRHMIDLESSRQNGSLQIYYS